jgi:hypothetical protein
MHRWKINARELHMFEELLEGTVRKWPKIITTRKNIFFLKKRARTLFIRTWSTVHTRTQHCLYVRVNTVHTYTWLFIRTRGHCSYTETCRAPIGQNEQEPDRSQREKAGLLYIYIYKMTCIRGFYNTTDSLVLLRRPSSFLAWVN